MKRISILFILSVIVIQAGEAQLWKQKRYEVLAGLGPTQFFGDVGGFSKSENVLGFRDLSFRQTRFNINGSLKYRILNNVTARLSLTYGMLHATDERGSNEARGYEVRTSVFEPALIGEYYFIKSNEENSYLFSRGRRTPFRSILSNLDIYVFTGFGGLSFNARPNDALEERGLPNSGFTGIIPAGVGANLLIMPDYNVGIEFGGRYCFSDYLDAYTSQQSSSNDVYYVVNFTFTYKILTGRNGLPQFLNKRRF